MPIVWRFEDPPVVITTKHNKSTGQSSAHQRLAALVLHALVEVALMPLLLVPAVLVCISSKLGLQNLLQKLKNRVSRHWV